MSLIRANFLMLIYRAYEQLTPIYDNISATGKKNCHKVVTKYLTYFPISQLVSGKGSMILWDSFFGRYVDHSRFLKRFFFLLNRHLSFLWSFSQSTHNKMMQIYANICTALPQTIRHKPMKNLFIFSGRLLHCHLPLLVAGDPLLPWGHSAWSLEGNQVLHRP